ncbi:MAG: hypothetical protein J0H25_08460 [Rhizobiales bacterium]|nr:hypothetical protein [Hyphomicrobiales bacterium]
MTRLLRGWAAFFLVSVVICLGSTNPARAATERAISATASCDPSGANGAPEVTVKIVNHSGGVLTVGYVYGFTTPQAFTMRMILADQGKPVTATVADGATNTLAAGWDNLRNGEGDVGGARIVTSLGPLTPLCGDARGDTLTLGPAPASAQEAKIAAVTTAATTLGQLESWRAYPALYTLLHSDAKAQVSFKAIACWYAAQYGTADSPADRGVFSTKVTSAEFGDWTWGVTDKHYPDAAKLTISQQIGNVAQTQPTTSSEHLVLSGGLWRWFFGGSRAVIDAQSTDCDLGDLAPAPSQSSPSNSAPGAGDGSITITNYTCPAGMTTQTFDPSSCSLDPAAAEWSLSGSTLAHDLTWTDVTQHHGPGYSWVGLSYGNYFIIPAVLPGDVSSYAVSGSANANRQDAGIAVTLSDSAPNVQLSIYLFPSPGNVQNGMGSVEVDFFDCQPGMTAATFDPTDCRANPQGFSNVTLTPGATVDASMLPGGPIFTFTDGTNLGGGAYQIDGLPAGTYEIGPGQNYSGPAFYSPDISPVGASGSERSTYDVTVDPEHPHVAIRLYRLSAGVG